MLRRLGRRLALTLGFLGFDLDQDAPLDVDQVDIFQVDALLTLFAFQADFCNLSQEGE